MIEKRAVFEENHSKSYKNRQKEYIKKLLMISIVYLKWFQIHGKIFFFNLIKKALLWPK